MMHRATLFNQLRRAPFGGRMSQAQVDGVEHILDAWMQMGDGDDRKLAYIIATSFHETGGRMQPVREGFATTDAGARRVVRNRRYGEVHRPTGHVYYGRGDVQLTWPENYRRMGDILGLDLYRNPDLALKSEVSKRILIEGMMRGASGRGDFTGKALEDYFNATTDDPTGARRIVNGTDRANLIAGYHDQILAAIENAREAALERREAEPDDPTPGPVRASRDGISLGAATSVFGGVLTSLQQLDNPYALAGLALIVAGAVVVITKRKSLRYWLGA